MKKDILIIILMVIVVVFGVGIRYYMQTGSFLPKEKTEVVQESKVTEERMEEVTSESPEEKAEEPQLSAADNNWGVVLSAKDVTPDGMTLVCTQSGGEPTGELSTGAWYEIEVSDGGQWKSAPIYAEVCWEDIAWIIPAEDVTQWEVNWTWIYGTLPAGEYRIVKEIMDFRQTGDYDTCRSYAYFTIE